LNNGVSRMGMTKQRRIVVKADQRIAWGCKPKPSVLYFGPDVTFPISVDFARRTFGFAYICRQGRVSHSVEEAFITWKMGCTAKSIVGRRWPMPGTPFEVVYFVDCQADKKRIPPKGIGSATL